MNCKIPVAPICVLSLADAMSSPVTASVKACFYRGGTSRGLFFRTRDLAPFTQRQRDAIICNAMGG